MYSVLIAVQYLCIFIAIAGMIYIYPKRATRQKYLLNLILTAIIINEMGYLFEMQATSMEAAVLAIKVAYLGKLVAELGILVFVLHYSNIKMPIWVESLLGIIHLFVLLLIWTCEYNDLYYKSIDYTYDGLFPHVVLTYGVVYNIFTVLTITYMVIILIICIFRFIQKKDFKERVKMLCLSTPPITFMIGLFLFRTGLMQGYDTTALSYLISAIFFIFTMVKFDLINERELAEDMLLEEFSEATLVLNKEGKIIYVNNQFEAIYPDYKTNDNVKNNILTYCENQEEIELNDLYYHVISKELEKSGTIVGTMYVLHDVTQAHMRMHAQLELQVKEETMARQKKQSDEMTMLLIKTLSDTIEAKDEYTRGHSNRVSEYATLIAQKMGLPEETISKISYAATLHDIGKIGVPDTVLNKPSKLTDEEYEIIKTHSSVGADILQKIDIISYAADIARHHHERYDGKGYPDGLAGDEISLEARIVAVADSFDAMSSRRIYRKPLDAETIKKELIKNKGLQFDPDVANALVELIDTNVICPGSDEVKRKTDNDNIDVEYLSNTAEKLISAVVQTVKDTNTANSKDTLTGLMLRSYGEEKIASLMKENPGALIFCDMDNLKPINDIYGHKSGDKALRILGEVIAKYEGNGIACRIGGDEFLLYLDNVKEKQATEIVESIIADFRQEVEKEPATSGATLSAGVCLTSVTDVYANALSKADKALYHVKQGGKANYYVYEEGLNTATPTANIDIDQITKSIREAGKYEGALDVEYRQFAKMYDYLHNVCERYDYSCSVVLVTLDAKSNATTFIDDIEQGMRYMEMSIRNTIRTVDVCTRYSSVQFLVVLLDAENENVDNIMNRIFAQFYKMNKDLELIPRYEVRSLFSATKADNE